MYERWLREPLTSRVWSTSWPFRARMRGRTSSRTGSRDFYDRKPSPDRESNKRQLGSCGLCDAAHIPRSAARAFRHEPTRASLGQRSGMQSLCLSRNEDQMATRNDNNDQNKTDQNKAADEATRTARVVTDEAARVGEQTARAGADVFRRGTETARESVQSGLNTATQSFQRMTDQFTKVLGFN